MSLHKIAIKFTLYISLLFSTLIFSQEKFVIKENGLDPKFLISKIDSLNKNDLYKSTLLWINKNEKKYKIAIENKTKNEVIQFYCVKGNAVSLHKQYFNVKYKISISFENGQYLFKPTKIQLKINSKYDLGWKDFDLNNSNTFFKKGKVKRKYKSYIKDIINLLNTIKSQLDLDIKKGKYIFKN